MPTIECVPIYFFSSSSGFELGLEDCLNVVLVYIRCTLSVLQVSGPFRARRSQRGLKEQERGADNRKVQSMVKLGFAPSYG